MLKDKKTFIFFTLTLGLLSPTWSKSNDHGLLKNKQQLNEKIFQNNKQTFKEAADTELQAMLKVRAHLIQRKRYKKGELGH